MRWLVLACLGAWGCVEANVVQCDNGRICPDGTVCEAEHGLCVHPDQLTVCTALAEGAECILPDERTGQCDKGTCVDQECGDGVITGTEECDTALAVTLSCAEGTEEYYDTDIILTCSPRCAFNEGVCETKCGDGIINGPPDVEKCDGDTPAGSCLDFGFERGVLACTSFCAPGIDACGDIGFLPIELSGGQIVYAAAVLGPDHYLFAAGDRMAEVVDGVQTDQDIDLLVNAFWVGSSTDIHGVTVGGGIVHSNGTTWTRTLEPTGNSDLNDVWGAAANDVWAVGTGEQILHYNGQTWTETAPVTSGGWFGVHGSSANNVYVVGSAGRIKRYTTQWDDVDASACWQGQGAPSFLAVWVSSATDVMVVGTTGWICHFNGSTWSRQQFGGSDNLRRLWGRSATDLYAATDGGRVFHYDGATWLGLDTGLTSPIYAIAGRDTELVIGGGFPRPRRYAGAGYAHADAVTPTAFMKVFTAGAGKDYALSNSGVYHYRDADWAFMRAVTEPRDMWVGPAGEILVSSGNAQNIHSYNGNTWTTFASTFSVKGLAARSATDIYAIGSAQPSQIARYTGTWSTLTLPVSVGLDDVAVGPTNVFVTGYDTGYVLMRFDGSTWSTQMHAANDTRSLYSIHAFADDDVYAVGDEGFVMHFDGTAWTEIDVGTTQTLVQVTGTSGRDVFIVGSGDDIVHFNGERWSPVLKPDPDTYFSVAVRDDLVLFAGVNLVTAIVRQGPWSAP